MKWIWLGVAAAWGGIVALAWWLADRRVAWCSDSYGQVQNCKTISALATRDNVLIWGASIPLALFVVALLLGRMPVLRLNRRERPSTTRALIDHE